MRGRIETSRPNFTPPRARACSCRCPAIARSVVWVTAPDEAERLMALSDDELSEAAERQSHSILGRMRVEPGRHVFPLAIEQPRQFASNRIALVGEAAHVLPPIGAQGLNMGLRDAADIADIVREAMLPGEDPGAPQVLSRLRCGAARRHLQPHLRHRHGQPFAAESISCRCSRARGRPASDRRDRPAAPPRHARGPGAVVAADAGDVTETRSGPS